MSQAMDDIKKFILKHGGAEFVDRTAADLAARPDAEARLRLAQAADRIEMELRGVRPVIANGLATGFAMLVRERLRWATGRLARGFRMPR